MPTMMQLLLCLSLLCYALAAPIYPARNDAIQVRHHGDRLTARSDQPQFGTSATFRQSNVLYPRPRKDVRRQAPTQSMPAIYETAPTVSNSSTGSVEAIPTFNGTTPADPMSSTASMPLTSISQSVTSANTSTLPLSTTFPQSTSFEQPTGFPQSTNSSRSAGFAQSTGQSSSFGQPISFSQSTSYLNSTGFAPSTSRPQPTAPTNNSTTTLSTSFSQNTSTSFLQTTSTSFLQTTSSSFLQTTSTISLQTGSTSSIQTESTSSLQIGSTSSPQTTSTSSFQTTSTTTLQPITTSSTSPTSPTQAPVPVVPGTLQLSLVNNLPSNNVNAYISAIESSSGRVVLVTPSGQFYYLPDTGSPIPQAISADIAIPLPPQGQSLQITIPGFVEGARVWFADGTLDFAVVSSINGPALVEPTAVRREDGSAYTNWGFVELAFVEGYGLFANISFVDFLGLPLALQLQTLSGATQTVPGVPTDAVQQVCDRLQSYQGTDARYWADLCIYGESNNLIRVISPAVLISQRPEAFQSFFQTYVDQVWAQYATETLTINTQNENGNVACRVTGDVLQCDGDNRGYAQPSAMDIFGCNSGPFSILASDNAIHRAVVPRLCAAFNRGTLLLEGGDVQPSLPPSAYYTAPGPQNLYSAVIHEVEIDGRGYAFSYDDVTPSEADGVAGIVSAADPQLLTVFVGGI